MADIHSTHSSMQCQVCSDDDDDNEEEAAERARREAGVLRNGHNSENLDEGGSPPNNWSYINSIYPTGTTIESVNGGYNSHNTTANSSCCKSSCFNSQNESSGSNGGNGGSYENQFSNPNLQYVPSQTNYGVVHYPTGIPVTASNPSQMNYNHHAAGLPATGIPNFPLRSPQNNFSDVLHPKNIPQNGESRFINGLEQGKTYQDLRDEHVKLRQLHEKVCQELERTQKREKVAVDKFTSEIRSLSIKIELLEVGKATLFSKLDECEERISDCDVQNKKLEGKITALESQLTSVTDAKNQAQSELEASEVTIEKLQRQLKGMPLPDSLSRLRKQHDSIISDLKLRQQNEVSELKKSIEKLESDLKSKSQDAKHFEDKLADLQKKYDKSKTEKKEIRRLQQHLDSEQVDASILRSQIESLEEDKIKLNEQNRELMDRNKWLENELNTSKAMQRIATSPLPSYKSESSERKQKNNKECKYKKKLKKCQSQEQDKAEIQNLHDKSTYYHTRSDDYENATEKQKETSKNEKDLAERCEKLQKKVTEMIERHAEEKKKAIEDCRNQCMEIHEKEMKVIKDKFNSESATELQSDCAKYENEIPNVIEKMQKHTDEVTMKLNEVQQDYLKICVENKILQKALDESTRLKERAEKQKQAEVRKFNEIKKKEVDVKVKDILHKERTALHQEFEKEKQALDQHCQSEWEKRCNHFKKQHEEQINLLKKDYEKKIQDLEKEIENQQLEVQSFKEVVSRKESEIDHHLYNIAGLTTLLKDNEGIENTLREKVNKYKRYCERKEKEYKNEVSALKRKVSDLQNKQDAIQLDKENYQQQLQKVVDEQAKKLSRSCEIQTEEEVVLKQENVKMKEFCLSWLRNILEEIKEYLMSAQARTREHLRQSVRKYIDMMASDLTQVYTTSLRAILQPTQE